MSQPRSVDSADDRQSGPATPARRVTSGRIDRTQYAAHAIDSLFAATADETPTSAEPGSTTSSGVPKAKTSPSAKLSMSSVLPIVDSDGHWDTPADLLGLAAQANALATQILNGEANLAMAREYARVTATIASLLRTEIERRRFVGGDPIRFPR